MMVILKMSRCIKQIHNVSNIINICHSVISPVLTLRPQRAYSPAPVMFQAKKHTADRKRVKRIRGPVVCAPL